jgi:mRNA-degrading endonuclease toxin of MazEF toxin-antitoxin module
LGRVAELMGGKVEKVTAVAEARLRDPIGEVDAETMRAVERALLLAFGIGAR